ncbi:MAG: M18 family aminopeptidase [Clostridium sp.]|nr:M18 family aminopeptidase [Clostridium sp.]
MGREKTAAEVLSFIERSPSCYHVIENLANALAGAGYTQLREEDRWKVSAGGRYFVTRNGSSLIAFRVPENPAGFHIIASHSDSPTFRLKSRPEMGKGYYTRLNIEKYGGMLCSTWFDRPLSVAGRILVKEGGRILAKTVHLDRDLLMIPSLAIHMNRKANEGVPINVQTDMLPVLCEGTSPGKMRELIAGAAGVSPEDILGDDLFLVNRQKGCFWGASEEFIASPKLDDLECGFTAFLGFLGADSADASCAKGLSGAVSADIARAGAAASRRQSMPVYCIFDNEEVGSTTKQGAASTFLPDTLRRVNAALGRDDEDYHRMVARSFMVSADNAHALHPNAESKADPVNRPRMNGGIVMKFSANQKYTTDGMSEAVFRMICEENGIPYQIFTNRSDMTGGSTLGSISNTQVSLNTVDIGLAQLAMHSSYESAGAKDPAYLAAFARAFFGSEVFFD